MSQLPVLLTPMEREEFYATMALLIDFGPRCSRVSVLRPGPELDLAPDTLGLVTMPEVPHYVLGFVYRGESGIVLGFSARESLDQLLAHWTRLTNLLDKL